MIPAGLHPEPKLVLFESAFAEELYGWGAIFYRGGHLKTRFSAHTTGSWNGRTLTFEEHLRYESGEEHHRTFHIEKLNDDYYTAQCV